VSGNRQKEGGDGANAKQVLDQEKVQFVVGMYYVFYVDICRLADLRPPPPKKKKKKKLLFVLE